MERLTEDCCINDSHCWQVKETGNRLCKEVCDAQADRGCDDCPLAKAIDKLAAYEDSGATPEMVQRLVQIIKDLGNAGGFDYLKALTQADTEGRLAVLPCRLGDTVYDISDGTAYPTRVLSFSYFGDRWACRTVSSYPDLEEFGTRIFLTREEAEQALKEAEEDEGVH